MLLSVLWDKAGSSESRPYNFAAFANNYAFIEWRCRESLKTLITNPGIEIWADKFWV
jgi:hypothetical protein